MAYFFKKTLSAKKLNTYFLKKTQTKNCTFMNLLKHPLVCISTSTAVTQLYHLKCAPLSTSIARENAFVDSKANVLPFDWTGDTARTSFHYRQLAAVQSNDVFPHQLVSVSERPNPPQFGSGLLLGRFH